MKWISIVILLFLCAIEGRQISQAQEITDREDYAGVVPLWTMSPLTENDPSALSIVQRSAQALGGSSLWLSVDHASATITMGAGGNRWAPAEIVSQPTGESPGARILTSSIGTARETQDPIPHRQRPTMYPQTYSSTILERVS